MIIELEFVEELRSITSMDMTERLNSDELMVRVRPAADMNCFVNLIDHVIKRTPFRKELRILKLARVLEDLYRNTSDPSDARNQAETYINQRLRRLFPDLSTGENNEMKARGEAIIDEVEARVLGDREKEKLDRKKEPAKKQVCSSGDVDELTEEEKLKGVMIGRVEMRVAGNKKRVPSKIMPDPEDESRMMVATRDSATGELVPQIRRGLKRYVERDREGIWQLVTYSGLTPRSAPVPRDESAPTSSALPKDLPGSFPENNQDSPLTRSSILLQV